MRRREWLDEEEAMGVIASGGVQALKAWALQYLLAWHAQEHGQNAPLTLDEELRRGPGHGPYCTTCDAWQIIEFLHNQLN